MNVHQAKVCYEKGVVLNVGDKVVISDSRYFSIMDVEIVIDTKTGQVDPLFHLAYFWDGRRGFDLVKPNNLHNWMKP